MTAEIPVAFGEEAQDSEWSAASTLRRFGARKAAIATERASSGSFLLERPVASTRMATGQGGRHIEHFFAPSHQLLSYK